MNENTQKQVGLFAIGEGDKTQKPTRKKTADLLARGAECITLARSNKVQYLLYAEKAEAYEKALVKIGKDKWIKIGDDFLPTDIAKLIVKFVRNYAALQCELITEMREIQATLKKRKIGFVFSDDIYPHGGC